LHGRYHAPLATFHWLVKPPCVPIAGNYCRPGRHREQRQPDRPADGAVQPTGIMPTPDLIRLVQSLSDGPMISLAGISAASKQDRSKGKFKRVGRKLMARSVLIALISLPKAQSTVGPAPLAPRFARGTRAGNLGPGAHKSRKIGLCRRSSKGNREYVLGRTIPSRSIGGHFLYCATMLVSQPMNGDELQLLFLPRAERPDALRRGAMSQNSFNAAQIVTALGRAL